MLVLNAGLQPGTSNVDFEDRYQLIVVVETHLGGWPSQILQGACLHMIVIELEERI